MRNLIFVFFTFALFYSNSTKAQNDTWVAVMIESSFAQTYETFESFPETFIKEQWAKSQYVTDISYGDDEWVVVTSAINYSNQAYYVSKTFPHDWVEKKWKEGFDFTNVTYGGGKWVLIMSKGAGLTSESWAKRSTFAEIKEFIRVKWDEGRDIIDLAYGNGEWVAVLAKGADYHYQTYNWGEYMPYKWINEKYEAGYNMTSITYGEGQWVAVMSQYSQTYEEKYKVLDEIPEDFIDDEWNDYKRIAHIHYNYEKDLGASFDEYYKLGLEAANNSKHELAVHYYTEALKIKPSNAVCYNNRAWSKYLAGQCRGALQDVDKSIQLDPQGYSYHTRGAIYNCLGRCHDAFNDFNTALSVISDPTAEYYGDRGQARACLGNTEEAIKDYDKALAIEPNNSTYKSARAKLKGKLEERQKPTITWDYPYNSFASTTDASYKIKACIHSKSDIADIQIYINGKTFASRGFGVEDDCTESVNQAIKLNPGKNEVEVVVKTAYHTVRSEKRTIEYKTESGGHYHALLIGVQSYDDFSIRDLEKPVADASKLKEVLTSKYTFNENDVHLLKNPTKDDILNKLVYLQDRLGEKDNLLIFYSGHGISENEVGYWLPSDSKKSSRSTWFSNAELRDYVNSIKSRHTLVVADACFSGSIFKGGYRDITEFACEEMGKMTSRRALTSGANTIVPDESVFFKYLIKKLEENNSSCVSAETLYSKIKPAVIYNSPNNQIPQFGVLPQSGDEGGNFIFRTK
ncbi:MAG: tetratricopeptide repeat protein [Aureispira sp.]|nr:tetratricopeptide repeat protein [Aureispira sp.]